MKAKSKSARAPRQPKHASRSKRTNPYTDRGVAKRTAAQLPSGKCACGCGGVPKSAKGRFLPGHDARMKPGSRWLQDHPDLKPEAE